MSMTSKVATTPAVQRAIVGFVGNVTIRMHRARIPIPTGNRIFLLTNHGMSRPPMKAALVGDNKIE
jgi:hypothetical protein